MVLKKMILELLSKNTKFKEVMEMGEKIKTNITTKKVSLSDVLLQVNNGEIKIKDQILLKGFLSKYACIEEPITYTSSKFLHSHDNVFNNEIHSMPVTCSTTFVGDNCLLFLYENNQKPFEFNAGLNNKVTNKNKFIPIIVSKEDYYSFMEKNVELICVCKPMDTSTAMEYFNYRTEEFTEIVRYFADERYEKIPWIYLEALEIHEVKTDDLSELKATFSIEYEMELNGSRDYCLDKIYDSIEEMFGFVFKKLKLYDSNGSGVYCFVTKNNDIQLFMKDHYISFCITVDLLNMQEYSDAIEKLTKCCKDFKNKTKGIKGMKVNYISDERKLRFFELD